MKPLVTDAPDELDALGPWLDRVVAGGGAARLADELDAVRGAARPTSPPGDGVALAVRQRGFAGLTPEQLRGVLRDPGALLALAEDALAHGGAFWTRAVAEGAAFDGRADAGRQLLMAELAPVVPLVAVRKRSFAQFAPWAASFATAAALLLAFTLVPGLRRGPEPRAVAAGWGWQKAGDIDPATPPADYYDRLADLADEWQTQDTSTALALALRIAEFRAGCARLQLTEHPALSAEQRQDLRARCQKWAKKFDANLGELETTGDTAKVRAAMTDTVALLGTALRGQATKLRAT